MNIPECLISIIKKEIEKFNDLKRTDNSNISWAENISSRIYCEGFSPNSDEILLEDLFYGAFYKKVSEQINSLPDAERKAIEDYNYDAGEHGELGAIDKAFYDIVEPLYYKMNED